MKYIKKEIILKINTRLTVRDRILMYIFKRYTYNIYKMGYLDGFKFRS